MFVYVRVDVCMFDLIDLPWAFWLVVQMVVPSENFGNAFANIGNETVFIKPKKSL